MCRICLRTSNDLKPMFDYKCVGVPILEVVKKVCYNLRYVPYENDSMPSHLCSKCIDVLCQAHQLNQTSLKSENQLQSTLCLPDPLRVKEEYGDLGPSVSISHLGSPRQPYKGTEKLYCCLFHSNLLPSFLRYQSKNQRRKLNPTKYRSIWNAQRKRCKRKNAIFELNC